MTEFGSTLPWPDPRADVALLALAEANGWPAEAGCCRPYDVEAGEQSWRKAVAILFGPTPPDHDADCEWGQWLREEYER